MKREFTCIICPNGCSIVADYEEVAGKKEKISVSGAICKRGEEYVCQELTEPKRTISSSVAVRNGELPLASVRLTSPIPKEKIFEVMEVVRGLSLEAPIRMGDVIVENILGLGSDLVATKNVDRV